MEAVTQFSVRIVQRYLPSAFVLAVMLTAIVFAFGKCRALLPDRTH